MGMCFITFVWNSHLNLVKESRGNMNMKLMNKLNDILKICKYVLVI